eukprot:TRINITY_DN26062_c0_g1_i1.p1 TRINITY_DN26062_c0_g1~~TRINITY_DN26062_c0_g1_i1.p1  ORF type:complete len:120 (+),score=14.13 TRINITY_DN26062_c0_g1_i1:411-770(+)
MEGSGLTWGSKVDVRILDHTMSNVRRGRGMGGGMRVTAIEDHPLFLKRPLPDLKLGEELEGEVVGIPDGKRNSGVLVDVGCMRVGYLQPEGRSFEKGQKIKVKVFKMDIEGGKLWIDLA